MCVCVYVYVVAFFCMCMSKDKATYHHNRIQPELPEFRSQSD